MGKVPKTSPRCNVPEKGVARLEYVSVIEVVVAPETEGAGCAASFENESAAVNAGAVLTGVSVTVRLSEVGVIPLASDSVRGMRATLPGDVAAAPESTSLMPED